MFEPWLCLKFVNTLLRIFVTNLKIDAFYAFYPESFCDKIMLSGKFSFFLTLHVENPAIRRIIAAKTGKTKYKLSLAQPMIPSKPRDTGSKSTNY